MTAVVRPLAATAVLVLVVLGLAPPFARAVGGPLVTETFTGATAHEGFRAFGSACLTGADEIATALPPGLHDLGGCSARTRQGPVPPAGADGRGFLQLTDASTDQAAAVLFDQVVPSAQGLSVTFEQWQYGSTTTTGGRRPADGIAFFLTGEDAQLTAPGAFGGSLGYAQKLPDGDPSRPFLPGVDDGYLGIGLDALGNYFGDWELRGDGCPADGRSPAGTGFRVPEPDKITVRGPGDGTEGYCFLTSTSTNLDRTTPPWDSTLPFSLRSDVTTVPADPAAAEAVLRPVRRTVTVTVTPAPDPVVVVSLARGDEAAVEVLRFDAPSPVPDGYKFGFSASTGQFTDVHLLRNVVIESVQPVQSLTLEKTVVGSGPYLPGDDVRYRYDVVNTGYATVEDLVVTDDRIDTVRCEATRLEPVTEAPRNATTCSGTYRVRAADGEAGEVVNTAVASAEQGGVTSNRDDAVVRVDVPAPGPTPEPTASSAAPPPPTAPDDGAEAGDPPADARDADEAGADGLPGAGAPAGVLAAAVAGVVLVVVGGSLLLVHRRRHGSP
ncbi:hypothetical protein [Aeromicrobium sp. IC_218]|uniref:DUF7507 domain-containing protein n=1 Tax=Aeromicrobium sp. IC_218 TaxID=2545468 RepID=UPI00103D28C4|nr:hypothetical protein [Aeromicrobium sp. IC_218]TCI97618.1 hypothetical protein E0W78_11235 [Aeromicrobium sp. IC_218]